MATKPTSKTKGRAHAARTQRRRAAQHRRQELARRRTGGPGALADRPRWRWAFYASLALVLAGAAAVTVVVARSASPTVYSLLSRKVSDTSGDRSISAIPSTYRVVYRFDSSRDDGSVSSFTQEVTVRRPFDGRSLYKAEAPPGTNKIAEIVSTLGRASRFAQGDEIAKSEPTPPDLALPDHRLDVSLPLLVELGVYAPRERRELLGRQCVVYHTGRPLEGRTLAKPTKDDYADICIDASGVILEQVSVRSGKLSARVTAVEVAVDNAIDDAFDVPPALAQGVGSNQLLPIDKTTTPAEVAVTKFWRLESAPAGFEHRGRWRYLESRDDPNAPPGTPPVPPVETHYDLYVSGDSVVIVRQGIAGNEPASSPALSKPIAVEGFNEPKLEAGVNGLTIVLHPTDDGYVHLSGTVPAEQLAAIAKTLRSS